MLLSHDVVDGFVGIINGSEFWSVIMLISSIIVFGWYNNCLRKEKCKVDTVKA